MGAGRAQKLEKGLILSSWCKGSSGSACSRPGWGVGGKHLHDFEGNIWRLLQPLGCVFLRQPQRFALAPSERRSRWDDVCKALGHPSAEQVLLGVLQA